MKLTNIYPGTSVLAGSHIKLVKDRAANIQQTGSDIRSGMASLESHMSYLHQEVQKFHEMGEQVIRIQLERDSMVVAIRAMLKAFMSDGDFVDVWRKNPIIEAVLND